MALGRHMLRENTIDPGRQQRSYTGTGSYQLELPSAQVLNLHLAHTAVAVVANVVGKNV